MTTGLVMSITDEMVAELEALCKNCIADNCADEDEQSRNETQFLLGINHEDVLALLAERKELVKDAGRYRWLRDGNSSKFLTFYACGFPHHELDEAIDAAMQSEAKP